MVGLEGDVAAALGEGRWSRHEAIGEVDVDAGCELETAEEEEEEELRRTTREREVTRWPIEQGRDCSQ